MSNDNSNTNQNTQNNPNEMHRQRRGSVTQQAIAGLFRSNSTSNGGAFPGTSDAQRRRLSVTTGLGLTGTSPTGASAFNSLRRGSLSTNSNDSIDENAIDEEEIPPNARTAPATPFTRRMSFGAQAMRTMRNGGGSPGSNGNDLSSASATPVPSTPAALDRRSSVHSSRGVGSVASSTSPANTSSIAAALSSARRRSSSTVQASIAHKQRSSSDVFSRPDQGFNWSEQLRSRAESSVQGPRASFSFGSGLSSSPPRGPGNGVAHDRQKSVSEMPAPPAQAAAMKPKAPERPKPDAFQERILKGDFYMD
ncbi:hypothetical protein COL5a_004205 [Colletotrichum fioriniae]|uniref:uncharacterized protein n=1 Tax=Colletotrichum fioriniae TaxID=710243 RepID=UPI002300E5F3|nr:uncharacterized protein COL516b_000299 [Colletotrichum fioriniae]KAJ0313363.1 hypothetical protein COL516b_000299 [Colletotrichum fioriniae]KAJ0329638.1 hypothetical protein COL5a_004205 [Colletotrichum fioriniae]KAJ3948327.1 hypothetical protein N0V96_002573 [Colletotrichum fioriniae]